MVALNRKLLPSQIQPLPQWIKRGVISSLACLFPPESYLRVEAKSWESVSLVFNQLSLQGVSSSERFKFQNLSDSFFLFLSFSFSLFLPLGGSGGEEGRMLEVRKAGPVCLELPVAA